ncbi:MAG: hypothetical protein P8Q37_04450 [Porticoccaceae bacterium]|nr:hypothetical protein [Porticoccaceae bacterium]MDG1474132.1 hypothetical protein [Porticoccaceae bacterium]
MNILSIASDGVRYCDISANSGLHLIDHRLRYAELTIGDDPAIAPTVDSSNFDRMILWRRAKDSGFICLFSLLILKIHHMLNVW